MDERVRIGIAEAVGTMILVVGGVGTAVLATGHFSGSTGSVGVLGVALAFGFSLLVAAYAIGSISGCHVNPAVTVGLWVIGKTRTDELPFYVVGQLVGGIAGAFVVYVISSSTRVASATATNLGTYSARSTGFFSNGYGHHSPGGFPLPAVVLAEIFFTAVFVFVVASTSRKSMPVGMTGVTIGLTLVVINLVAIPIDDTSVNPARSLATAVFQGSWAFRQLWVFIVFPVVGGVLGAAIWRALRPESDEEAGAGAESRAPAPYGKRDLGPGS